MYEYANKLASRGHKVCVVHPHRVCSKLPHAPNFRSWLRRSWYDLRYTLSQPNVQRWQAIDPRVRLHLVPNLAARYVPDADAVFATAWNTAECVCNLPASKGEKFYLIQHYETWSGPKERVDATWKMPLHKVVIADWLYNLGIQLGCQDMVRVPNGFDHSIFRVSKQIQNRPPRVAMMYSNLEWKGSADGLAALERAKSTNPDMEAVLFGVAHRPQTLPRWIEYLQDPSKQDLVEKVYNSARIFICPSWTEGFPLPPAEAISCGCALVSTTCTGISEYAEHGITALLSPPKDPASLAKNLLTLLDDDDLRVRIALEGHKHIKTFTWDRSTDLLEGFINSRLSSKWDRRARRASGVASASRS